MAGEISVKGGTTKTKIFTGPEAHKLHLEFDLNPTPSADLIHRGQPVKLAKVTYDGADYDVVVPAESNEPQSNIIGISIHEQDSAYKGAIVVATRGYAVTLNKVSGDVEIGDLVSVGDGSNVYDDTSGYCIVSPALNTAATPAYTEDLYIYGWALESASSGDIIKVLVKN